MEDSLISFETAKLAKEKGFDIPCDGRYYWDYEWKRSKKGATQWKSSEIDSYPAPTQSLLQKWLREQHTPIIITPVTDFVAWEVEIKHPDMDVIVLTKNSDGKWFDSYEEALEYGLQTGLNLIKK